MGEQALALVERESVGRAGTSGRKSRTGCGSNVATIHRPPHVEAERDRPADDRWWPRWKPSKLPSARTAPRILGNDLVVMETLHRARLYRRIAVTQSVGRKVLLQQPYSWTASTITKASRIESRSRPTSLVKL
jgi:hypothetical protein